MRGQATSIIDVTFKVRFVFMRFPEEFINCYNACFTGGIFPSRWKSPNLVLLHKGQGRPRDLPPRYRPISLLDGDGKVFERVLLNKLEEQRRMSKTHSTRHLGVLLIRRFADVRSQHTLSES